jgi:hypothetical protein
MLNLGRWLQIEKFQHLREVGFKVADGVVATLHDHLV